MQDNSQHRSISALKAATSESSLHKVPLNIKGKSKVRKIMKKSQLILMSKMCAVVVILHT